MKWQDIKDKIAKVAPVAGTLLGGPAGGTVGAMVASVLGVDNTPAAVNAVLGDPEATARLRELEATHSHEFRSLALTEQRKTLEAELGDKQNAREHHKHSKMPAVIVGALTAMVAGLLYAIFNAQIPEAHESLAMMMFGQVIH